MSLMRGVEPLGRDFYQSLRKDLWISLLGMISMFDPTQVNPKSHMREFK